MDTVYVIIWLLACLFLTIVVYQVVKALKSAKTEDNLEKYYKDEFGEP